MTSHTFNLNKQTIPTPANRNEDLVHDDRDDWQHNPLLALRRFHVYWRDYKDLLRRYGPGPDSDRVRRKLSYLLTGIQDAWQCIGEEMRLYEQKIQERHRQDS